MPKVVFRLPDGSRHDVEVPEGHTVLEAARVGGIDIEGACGGSMACATCHVHVAPEYFDVIDPPADEEEDMLDLAETLRPTSRLGCQIRIDSRLDGLVVDVPRTSLLC